MKKSKYKGQLDTRKLKDNLTHVRGRDLSQTMAIYCYALYLERVDQNYQPTCTNKMM